MKIQFRHISITTDKFIALILALIIIYFAFRQLESLMRKKVRNRKTSEFISKALLMIFMAVVVVFLLNYVFRWF